MKDEPELDVSEVAALLHIEEKTRAQPRLKRIHDWVTRALEKHDVSLIPEERPRPAQPVKETA